MPNDFKYFWKTKLSQKDLKSIRETIEEKEEEGVKPKKIMTSIKRGRSKKLDEPYKVERVYRTESSRLHSEKVKSAAEKFNRHHFKVMVEKNACPRCQKLKGRIFTDKDLMKGVIVPVHPNCECVLLIYNPNN